MRIHIRAKESVACSPPIKTDKNDAIWCNLSVPKCVIINLKINNSNDNKSTTLQIIPKEFPKKVVIHSLKIDLILVTSADTNEMPRSMTFHQCSHFLPNNPFRGFQFTKIQKAFLTCKLPSSSSSSQLVLSCHPNWSQVDTVGHSQRSQVTFSRCKKDNS